MWLVYPLKPERLHQAYDALEARAHVQRQRIEFRLGFGVNEDERPRHTGIYLFCNDLSSIMPDVADIAFADGAFTIAGTDRAMPIGQVAQRSFMLMGLPSELGVGLQGAGAFSPGLPSFANGCHICEVEVDPETGEVVLDRYAAVDDIGTVINPLLATGHGLAPIGVN